ncbi:hypothetical protein MRY87_09520 [bacterium]|nr:hypothetical protein [bacterium]
MTPVIEEWGAIFLVLGLWIVLARYVVRKSCEVARELCAGRFEQAVALGKANAAKHKQSTNYWRINTYSDPQK